MDTNAILRRHSDALMARPNVRAVGVGERDGKPIIIVFVSKKLPLSEIPPDQAIPAELDGCRVEVEETGGKLGSGPGTGPGG